MGTGMTCTTNELTLGEMGLPMGPYTSIHHHVQNIPAIHGYPLSHFQRTSEISVGNRASFINEHIRRAVLRTCFFNNVCLDNSTGTTWDLIFRWEIGPPSWLT